MLSKSGMNYTTIEQDLGSIRDRIEVFQRLVKLIIIVVGKCRHPCLDFLFQRISFRAKVSLSTQNLPVSETS